MFYLWPPATTIIMLLFVFVADASKVTIPAVFIGDGNAQYLYTNFDKNIQ
jgi:hypothetical protein